MPLAPLLGGLRTIRIVDSKNEQHAVQAVEERLQARFPDIDPADVKDVPAELTGPLTDFVPVLVEHAARERLARRARIRGGPNAPAPRGARRTMTSAARDEIKRKYEVASSAVFPELDGRGGVTRVGQPAEHELEAVYFDTPGLDLARWGVTLRRRTGGEDAGWHLKVPGGRDTRAEFPIPLGRAVKTVPNRLLDPVRAIVRDRPVRPVAQISTRRREYSLLSEDGTVAAVACDDRVHAQNLIDGSGPVEWREWEVELVDADRALLDSVERDLLGAGASPASAASKLHRTLGESVPSRVAPRALKGDGDSTGALLQALVAEQVAELHAQDPRVRADEPGSVHRLRIAARRLRSVLTTYRQILEPGFPGPLREELRWLGLALSKARDAQVLGTRLDELVSGEPPELVLGPVAARIDTELQAAYRAGLDEGREALGSERYFRLLDSLDLAATALPLTAAADTPASDLVPRLLRRDSKHLRCAVDAVHDAHGEQARDLALHEARKKAKRLRYAAESAIPVFGGRAKTLAKSVKRMQDSLGLHQDSVVARQRLRELGVQAHLSSENGFTFGRLHALEERQALLAEEAFEEAWAQMPQKDLRRWLRR